jgi:hypothetical protein
MLLFPDGSKPAPIVSELKICGSVLLNRFSVPASFRKKV